MAALKVTGVDGPVFKRALLGSLSWLSTNHEEVNRLNVFPVPDGDTGTNMLLTLQSAVEDIKESNAAEVSNSTNPLISRRIAVSFRLIGQLRIAMLTVSTV